MPLSPRSPLHVRPPSAPTHFFPTSASPPLPSALCCSTSTVVGTYQLVVSASESIVCLLTAASRLRSHRHRLQLYTSFPCLYLNTLQHDTLTFSTSTFTICSYTFSSAVCTSTRSTTVCTSASTFYTSTFPPTLCTSTSIAYTSTSTVRTSPRPLASHGQNKKDPVL